jgi:nicotinate-nucleotide pyrophosphorylase (carboxylating)
MLKDNHVDLAGGVEKAINKAKSYLATREGPLPIEIETRSLEEVRAVIRTGGVKVIMLDNMSMEEMQEAVKMINGKFKTEASGGINESNLLQVAECGVDYISVGGLTHSVKSLDLSLKVSA